MITKAERTELRSLIRQRFKLLRAEVAQRQAELAVELERLLGDKLAEKDRQWADAVFLVGEAVREANRKANDAVRAFVGDSWQEKEVVTHVALGQPTAQERGQLRREGTARIEAQVRAANLKLDQQEADLLTRLAMGVLESDEARSFLGEIPTVSALVPAVRLLELEKSLRGETS